MDKPSLGEQELEVWRFIADHAPISGREVVAQFAEQRGLARSTVLTVIERLRKKGYLTRRRRDGVFHYSPRVPVTDVVQGLVRHFVEKTLAGSVSPLVAYLGKAHPISDAELAELQRLVDELKAQREQQE
jgi:predicted transcriptional regulator